MKTKSIISFTLLLIDVVSLAPARSKRKSAIPTRSPVPNDLIGYSSNPVSHQPTNSVTIVTSRLQETAPLSLSHGPAQEVDRLDTSHQQRMTEVTPLQSPCKNSECSLAGDSTRGKQALPSSSSPRAQSSPSQDIASPLAVPFHFQPDLARHDLASTMPITVEPKSSTILEAASSVDPISSGQIDGRPKDDMHPDLSTQERKALFSTACDALNIDWDNPPEPILLAKIFREMKIPGLKHQSIGQFAANLIRRKTSKEYQEVFFLQLDKLNGEKSRQVRMDRKYGRLGQSQRNQKSMKKKKTAKDGASSSTPYEQQPTRSAPRDERKKSSYLKAIQALEERGFWMMSIEELEERSRDFCLKNSSSKKCPQVIVRYLKENNRTKDATRFLKLRDNYRRRLKYSQKLEAGVTPRRYDRSRRGQ